MPVLRSKITHIRGGVEISMKAITIIPSRSGSLQLRDIPVPKTTHDEVLVKVLRVGIDGTDKEINQGLYGEPPKDTDYLVLGHEAVGIVEKTPEKFEGKYSLNQGDIVVPMVRRPDDCHYCQAGQPDMCEKGDYTERGIKGQHGFLSEYFTEEPEFLIKIPKGLENVSVLLEPLSVVEKGIRQGWKIQERMAWKPRTALVTGMGPIGILAALILRLKELDVHVYSKEKKDDPRVKLLEKAGINYHESTTSLRDFPDRIAKSIDFILEATGNSIIAMDATRIIGINGAVCLTGVTGGHKEIQLCADCWNLHLVLGNRLIYGTVNANKVDFENGLIHMKEIQSKFPNLLERMITGKFSPDQFKEAIEKYQGLKAIIEF